MLLLLDAGDEDTDEDEQDEEDAATLRLNFGTGAL